MKLIPYRWYELEIPLPPGEVVRRLEEWTRPEFAEGTFMGSVSEKTINITRRLTYKNSTVPFLRGSVRPSIAGSRLRFRLGPHPLVLLFMLGIVPCAIWLHINFATLGPWVPGLMVVAPLAAAIGSFYWEGPKLLGQVADCLDVDPAELEARLEESP